MTRQTAPNGSKFENFEDDEFYSGELHSFKIEPSKNPQYPDDQLKVEWKVKGSSDPLGDFLSIKLGQRQDGTVSKLRQMLNALSERPRDTELWFDPETFEWGYDLDDMNAAADNVLRQGQPVLFRGERRKKGDKSFYRITGYKSAAKVKK